MPQPQQHNNQAEQGVLSEKDAKALSQKNSHFKKVVFLAALVTVVVPIAECYSPTAYGRFGDSTTIGVNPKLGWFLMELPCSMAFLYFFPRGSQANKPVPRFFAGMFLLHYFYRGGIFPALVRVHGNSTNFSLLPAAGSWGITTLHAYLNAKWYGDINKKLNSRWLKTWKFVLGFLLYYSGLASTIYHDHLMRTLRDGTGPRYRIPHGGLFEYSTCAHYFSELWMWFGFMIMSWGPNGAFMFLVSLGNLGPRSITTHQWYLSKFDGMDGAELYPANRTQLVPLLW